ncbi:MAG TPA: IS3 family transposase [Rhodanobacter sp.]|nr:IS3 family transposase [Rhodanobacter sp.]
MKYDFMRSHTHQFSLAGMCRVLSASRSGYYAWRHRGPSTHQRVDLALAAHVRRVHVASGEAYGARKVWKALVAEGIPCGRHRVARVRRESGIEARRRRRFKVTHYARRHKNTAPDRLLRRFQAERPNLCWVGDVTFISTREGWLYLAVLIDLCSRKVVGWAMSHRNDEPLVSDALRMAITHRQPAAGLIHHTDRGVLYSSGNYRRLMAAHGLLPSMSRQGDCYDNACAESFFSTLKNELTHGQAFATRDAARMVIVSYIEGFYNRKRLHQTLGYRTPMVVDDEAMSA